jgi:hypothetical protein
MDTVATPEIFEVKLPEPILTKSERETRAFYRLLPELLTTHKGQWVAIHNEEVVDCGPNDIELILRVRAKVGYVALHVGFVTTEKQIYRIPHFRQVHKSGTD